MDEDNARIRVKIGALEIEYEGRASFLQDDLVSLMERIVSFYGEHRAAIPIDAGQPNPADEVGPTNSFDDLEHSTSTIAAHLGASSGPELAIAAAAHLAFTKQKGQFTRREIDSEMKSATTYYNKNMSSNLSKTLNTSVKAKRLNHIGGDNYALSATERKALEVKLGQPL